MPKKQTKKVVKKVKKAKGPVAKTHIIAAPEKTFFYELKNGTVFACTENEAWLIHRKFKQVGVSSGEAYAKIVREMQAQKELPVSEIRDGLARAFEAELKAAKGHLEAPRDLSMEAFGQRAVSPSAVQGLVSRR